MKTFSVIAMSAMALVAQAQTGHYKPYSVSADFHEVSNYKTFTGKLQFNAEQRALLKKNLFFVAPANQDQPFFVYANNDYLNLPSIVTTDTVLHLYHVFFDATLRRLEQDSLLPRLVKLSQAMVDASRSQYASAKDPVMKEAARKNLAYFSVALALAQGSAFSADDSAESAAELRMVEGAQGFQKSAIFPYRIDYTRFIPRGHYTKTEGLKRYFRAMTWYGMVPFALTDAAGKPQGEQIRMAVLASDALKSSRATPLWEAIYEPTELYVGASNTLTPQEVRDAAIDVFGTAQRPSSTKFAPFVKALKQLRRPKIRADIKEMTEVANPEVQFRFMGLRYIPDSEIMQRLTNNKRPMTTGLDVMAVLGSNRAVDLLDSNASKFNPLGWQGYLGARSKLTTEFASLPADTWKSNLYWGWFDALRLLVRQTPAGYPSFMRTQAWEDKTLSTALGSWTELRHDTILYGEQSVAEMGGPDEEPPFVKGFVEPKVAVYERLLALSKQSRVELQKRGLISKNVYAKFVDYEDLLSFLASVSKKELAGTPLSKKEHERIRYIEGEMSDLTATMLMYGGNFKALTEDDWNMALIADVHTGGLLALEEAIGKADDLFVVVPIEGKLYLARGGVFSYYEFAVPIADRMTDEAWKQAIDKGTTPPRPFWTSSYLSKTSVKDKN